MICFFSYFISTIVRLNIFCFIFLLILFYPWKWYFAESKIIAKFITCLKKLWQNRIRPNSVLSSANLRRIWIFIDFLFFNFFKCSNIFVSFESWENGSMNCPLDLFSLFYYWIWDEKELNSKSLIYRFMCYIKWV
jgi:hypothetical protein